MVIQVGGHMQPDFTRTSRQGIAIFLQTAYNKRDHLQKAVFSYRVDFRRLSHSAKISTDFLSICPDMVIAAARFMFRSINSMGTI